MLLIFRFKIESDYDFIDYNKHSNELEKVTEFLTTTNIKVCFDS